ncbi:hypothetical protein HK102_003784 [Quaeritorhiza haematococci]|nr:hypothetical protein HK102_003784 [Quaeritorhiza haematococci]
MDFPTMESDNNERIQGSNVAVAATSFERGNRGFQLLVGDFFELGLGTSQILLVEASPEVDDGATDKAKTTSTSITESINANDPMMVDSDEGFTQRPRFSFRVIAPIEVLSSLTTTTTTAPSIETKHIERGDTETTRAMDAGAQGKDVTEGDEEDEEERVVRSMALIAEGLRSKVLEAAAEERRLKKLNKNKDTLIRVTTAYIRLLATYGLSQPDQPIPDLLDTDTLSSLPAYENGHHDDDSGLGRDGVDGFDEYVALISACRDLINGMVSEPVDVDGGDESGDSMAVDGSDAAARDTSCASIGEDEWKRRWEVVQRRLGIEGGYIPPPPPAPPSTAMGLNSKPTLETSGQEGRGAIEMLRDLDDVEVEGLRCLGTFEGGRCVVVEVVVRNVGRNTFYRPFPVPFLLIPSFPLI